MYDAIFIEDLGKPAIVLVNEDFMVDATSAKSSRSRPALRFVAEAIPPECTVGEEIDGAVDAVIEDIVAALIDPLSAEEATPPPKPAEAAPRIVFKGNLKEVNQFFYRRGWGDGLPLIPPTEEEVAEMLSGTDLPPDHVVGTVIPRLGKATVEKIAVNAVMAGALPTYMPVLIAAVEALLDPAANFGTTEVSTASWAPFWIINGPIRHDLYVNSGQGVLSPGDIANAAIGRAMGLIVKNIGGARKGVEDMGTYGNPAKYSMVAGEDEEGSPWEPFHVEQGFERADSTVTVSFPTGLAAAWPFGSDAKGILRGITAALRARQVTIMINPQHARTLAKEGWTKSEIAAFVAENARVPAYQHQHFWGIYGPRRIRPPLNAGDSAAVLWGAHAARVLVAGGAGGLTIRLITEGLGWVTKKVTLPASWPELVQRYKDIVPSYAKY